MEIVNLNELQREIYINAEAHGFWEEGAEGTSFGEKIALIHSEVSEALEAYRIGQIKTTISPNGKPEGAISELVDVLIRTLDLLEKLGADTEYEIRLKHAYNKTRPYKHGKVM